MTILQTLNPQHKAPAVITHNSGSWQWTASDSSAHQLSVWSFLEVPKTILLIWNHLATAVSKDFNALLPFAVWPKKKKTALQRQSKLSWKFCETKRCQVTDVCDSNSCTAVKGERWKVSMSKTWKTLENLDTLNLILASKSWELLDSEVTADWLHAGVCTRLNDPETHGY